LIWSLAATLASLLVDRAWNVHYCITSRTNVWNPTADLRLNITQHANSLFVIKMSFRNQFILSEPIRSVSKPEQIRKKLAQCDVAEIPSNAEKASKKRARSEELLEALATIQQSQQEQTDLISALLHERLRKRHGIEESLNCLINHCEDEDGEQRPTKLRRFVSSLGEEKKRVLLRLGHVLVSLTDPNQGDESPSPYSPMEELNILGAECSENSSEDISIKIEDDFVGDQSFLNWFAVTRPR